MSGLSDSVQTLKGIGPKKTALYRKLGIETLSDALEYFPREYEQIEAVRPVSSVREGTVVSLCLEFDSSARVNRQGKRHSTTVIKGHDDTGRVECIWFNQPYRGALYRQDHPYFVMGRAEKRPSGMQIQNPVVEDYNGAIHRRERRIPVYGLTNGLAQRDLRFLTGEALKRIPDEDEENREMDAYLAETYGFLTKREAYRNIHYPSDGNKLNEARQRLVFEEFLTLLTAAKHIRNQIRNKAEGFRLSVPQKKLDGFFDGLPFRLTDPQERVLREVRNDLSGGKVMNRLIQGDVGSGKTVIAAAALFVAVFAGVQGVMMAPTEILARQHLETLSRMMAGTGIRLGLLTGSMKDSEKKETKEGLAAGRIDILLGTHAVLQKDVVFQNLGLVITDEQHRFGVRQRTMLQEKGRMPHILVMSATPIPRTLAHILYGDLDLSVIDSLPPGRVPVRTYHVTTAYRERIYRFVKKYAEQGNQSYIVCPLVEESEKMDLNAATQVFEELSHGWLSGIRMGLLHGGMKPREKEDVMEAFAAERIQVLVSTTVIEVGVNVQNAVIMVIEDANRFGLAQLHQLRGRVGRGDKPSFCILVTDGRDKNGNARLKALVDSADGFEIAEKDLEWRGPGDYYGLRQHGIPEFKIADPLKDHALLELARKVAEEITDHPEKERYRVLAEQSVEKIQKTSDIMPADG